MLLALAALLPFALAHWQWQRGARRSAALSAFERAAQRPAQPLLEVADGRAPDYRRVAVSGAAAGRPLLLANSNLEETPGVRVLTPYRLTDGSIVLVEQGWLPQARLGQAPAAVPASLVGRWVPLPARFTLASARIAAEGETDSIDLPLLVRRYNAPVRNGLVAAETVAAPLKPWPQRPPFNPQQNYSYAVQWVLIGIGFLIGAGRIWRGRHGQS